MSAERIASALNDRKRIGGDRHKLSRHALQIWRASKPGQDTPVQTYLMSRSSLGSIQIDVPEALRFHPGLEHPSGQTWPAMVALVSDGRNGNPLGIHAHF